MPWRKLPLPAHNWLPPASNPLPYAGLLSSLAEEHDYDCEVTGQLPELSGTLYRVGPGLYDRGPDRRRMMLDGDGMLQSLSFAAGKIRYRNRFVRTAKYLAEEAAGRFLLPSFSTHGSGPLRHNLGLRLGNQANTTVLEWAGRVFAFDEAQRPYELTAELATIGEARIDPLHPQQRYWAHWKLDSAHRQLHLLDLVQGPRPVAQVTSLDLGGAVVARHSIPLPRSVYIHDWFVTPRFFALLLHPAYLDPGRLLRVLVGRETFATALAWHPERGSLLQVAERGGSATWTCEMEPCWMWHAINAFDAGPELVLDFIGGDMGGGLGDETSPLFAIMRGEPVVMPPEPVNYPRRCRVNLSSGKIAQQVIDASANFELPGMSATERGLRYRKAYMIKSGAGELFARSLCQLDGESLETCSYQFPPGEFCGEPVVCDSIDGSRSRSIVTQVYSAETKTSYFAVFDERQFESGPVARVQLRHHVPLSFHGYWSAHSGAPQGKAPRNGAAMSPGARLRT